MKDHNPYAWFQIVDSDSEDISKKYLHFNYSDGIFNIPFSDSEDGIYISISENVIYFSNKNLMLFRIQ